jgi:hypothetical protein
MKLLKNIGIFGIIMLLLSFQHTYSKHTTETSDTYFKNGEVHLWIFRCDTIRKDLLNGVWSESVSENALFVIRYDSLYYLEDLDNPISLVLKGNMLIMKGMISTKCNILKLTCDSLWFTDEYSDDITKLVRIREN